jgi:hypothetical protein
MKTINYTIILLLTITLSTGNSFAQQQIFQGLRTPRFTTIERDKISTSDNIRAEGQVIYNIDNNCLEFWDGKTWRSFCENTRWFYMPSIVIDVSISGTFSRDLHLEYKKQFADTDNNSVSENSPTAGAVMIKSDEDAPNPFGKIYEKTELYYYIIGYDTDVFSNIIISKSGLMTYRVDADKVTPATYMNIVFVVK